MFCIFIAKKSNMQIRGPLKLKNKNLQEKIVSCSLSWSFPQRCWSHSLSCLQLDCPPYHVRFPRLVDNQLRPHSLDKKIRG